MALQPHLRAIATTPGSVRSSLVRFAIVLVWPWVRFGCGFGSAMVRFGHRFYFVLFGSVRFGLVLFSLVLFGPLYLGLLVSS